ncbi:MAG: hypothetical protein JW781_03705 [Deltaproteobacteria bacterium]|nr:hypothetical protein [Candidatus Anaeroferrophillacea bacterium]
MEASEREQNRLARELRDGLCQDLKSLEIKAALREDALVAGGENTGTEIAAFGRNINRAVRTAYDLARGMLPVGLDAKNFGAALAALAGQTRTRTDSVIRTNIQNDLKPPATRTPITSSASPGRP